MNSKSSSWSSEIEIDTQNSRKYRLKSFKLKIWPHYLDNLLWWSSVMQNPQDCQIWRSVLPDVSPVLNLLVSYWVEKSRLVLLFFEIITIKRNHPPRMTSVVFHPQKTVVALPRHALIPYSFIPNIWDGGRACRAPQCHNTVTVPDSKSVDFRPEKFSIQAK
jgi:hypothetical protein